MAKNMKEVEELEPVKEVKPVEEAPKKYYVKTQVANFNGEVAGVQFAYGKSAVPLQDGWILNWFKERGYTIEEA